MSYQVLARKYRPRTFHDVVGQDHAVLGVQGLPGRRNGWGGGEGQSVTIRYPRQGPLHP